MPLRKSPRLTPALLAAARRNAQHSTGPRSAAAKQNSKFNGLKHGRYALPEPFAWPAFAELRWMKTRRNPNASSRYP